VAEKDALTQSVELTEMIVIGIDKEGKFYCTLRGVTAYNALRHVAAASWYLGKQAFPGDIPAMVPLEPHVHTEELKTP